MLGFLLYTRLGRALAGAAAILAVVAGIYLAGRHDGAEGEQDRIEEQNDEAGDAADAAATDARACFAAGRVWDFGAGKCLGPIPGGR